MDDFRADLHCHTTCSDGTLSPIEIVQLAKDIGLSGLSITDHDTIEAYATAIPKAKEIGLELLTGVEFSAFQDKNSVHILGYSFAHDNSVILDFCKQHQERRHERNQAILDLLAKNNMPVSLEEVLAYSPTATGSIGRPHIAHAMVKKGYVGSMQEAFRYYLAENKPCYARGTTFSVEQTIGVIHEGGGVAIMAHPHLCKNSQLIQKLFEYPFDGIEGYYARLPPADRWIKAAEKKGWLITGGSDFHGDLKPTIALGSSWVDAETFKKLLNKHRPI